MITATKGLFDMLTPTRRSPAALVVMEGWRVSINVFKTVRIANNGMGSRSVWNGRRKERPFRDALRLEIAEATDGNDFRSLRRIARELLKCASTGDTASIREIADRLDGKVPRGIGGDDELDPIKMIEVRWKSEAGG